MKLNIRIAVSIFFIILLSMTIVLARVFYDYSKPEKVIEEFFESFFSVTYSESRITVQHDADGDTQQLETFFAGKVQPFLTEQAFAQMMESGEPLLLHQKAFYNYSDISARRISLSLTKNGNKEKEYSFHVDAQLLPVDRQTGREIYVYGQLGVQKTGYRWQIKSINIYSEG